MSDKSWKEIDRERDKSSHRKSSGGGKNDRDERSNSKYKQDLEKLFQSGGNVPDRFEEVMGGLAPEEGTDEARRQEAIESLRETDGFRDFAKEVNIYMKRNIRLPDDEDLLIRMLDHPDNDIVYAVLAHILDLSTRRELQRTTPIKSRLATIRSMSDDTELHELAARVEDAIS